MYFLFFELLFGEKTFAFSKKIKSKNQCRSELYRVSQKYKNVIFHKKQKKNHWIFIHCRSNLLYQIQFTLNIKWKKKIRLYSLFLFYFSLLNWRPDLIFNLIWLHLKVGNFRNFLVSRLHMFQIICYKIIVHNSTLVYYLILKYIFNY